MSKAYRGKIANKLPEEYTIDRELFELMMQSYLRQECSWGEILGKLQSTLGYSRDRAITVVMNRRNSSKHLDVETDEQKKHRWKREMSLEAQILKKRYKK